MRLRWPRPLAAIALVLGVAAGCSALDPIDRPAAVTGEADFSSYVAIGTSVSMGIQSGGLLDVDQRNSFPALLAGAAGANGGTFTQPLVDSPGIPATLVLVGVGPSGLPLLALRPGTPPTAPSLPRPIDGYDNLGISGAILGNALAKLSGDDPTNYFDLVLQGQGTMIRQCLAQDPTFVTVELGLDDAIRAVIRGSDTFLVSNGEFTAQYVQLMDSLTVGAPDAKLALANIIDVTDVPYATAVPLDIVVPTTGGGGAPLRLRDGAGPLPDGSRILLTAAPYIAVGYGSGALGSSPLPDSLVLTVAEVTNIRAAVASFNAVIAAQATARGAALADANGVFRRAHAGGVVVGGARYTTRYVTGGLFSVDGIHPSSLGHGLFANEFIRAINARFGATIAPVDLARLQSGE